MNASAIFRYAALIISAAAMVAGLLIVLGVFIPPNFPGQFRVILGITVTLYGLYRFVVVFFRQTGG